MAFSVACQKGCEDDHIARWKFLRNMSTSEGVSPSFSLDLLCQADPSPFAGNVHDGVVETQGSL